MRVVQVFEAIEAGVARHVTDVVCRVPGEHHVVVPPTRTGGFTDEHAFAAMRSAGAEVHLTRMRRSVADPHNARAVWSTRRLIRSLRPDIVHGHASVGGAVARLAAARTGAACVYTPHGLLPNRGVFAAERILGRLTDAFVAVSPSEAELVERRRLVPAGRVVVIPNGIETERVAEPALDLRSRLGLAEGTPLVGSVGRLARQKDPLLFVAACARLAEVSDARFVLIGEGPLRAAAEREVEARSLGDRFLIVPGLQDAASVMGQLDVFVLPSRYEGAPYAPLEAMRAGTPVVLSDVVGNRDVVVDGESGLLVPPGDPVALAAAVMRIIEEDGLGEALAKAARVRLAAAIRPGPDGRAHRVALRDDGPGPVRLIGSAGVDQGAVAMSRNVVRSRFALASWSSRPELSHQRQSGVVLSCHRNQRTRSTSRRRR